MKRRKEWARLERRLAERGGWTRASRRHRGLRALPRPRSKGWKGARGTALIEEPTRAAFAREAAEVSRATVALRVHELALDGAAIASGVELRAGRRAFFWKIAYDEAFAAYSPGVLLTRALSRRNGREGEVDVDRFLRRAGSSDDRPRLAGPAGIRRSCFAVRRFGSVRPLARLGTRRAGLARADQSGRCCRCWDGSVLEPPIQQTPSGGEPKRSSIPALGRRASAPEAHLTRHG